MTDFHKYTVEQARNKTLNEDFSANITQYSTGMVDQTMRNWSITFKDDKAPAYMKANALGGVVLDVVTLATLSSALRLGKLKLGKTQLIKQEIAAEDRIKLIGFKNKKLDLSISRPKVTQSNKTTTKQTSIKAPSITTVATKQKSKSGLSANQQKQIKIENVYVKKDKALITQSAANDSVLTQQKILAGGQNTGIANNSAAIVSASTQVNKSLPDLPKGYFYRTANNKVQVVRKDASSLPKLNITAGGKLYNPVIKKVATVQKSKAGNNSGMAQQILAGGQKTASMKRGGSVVPDSSSSVMRAEAASNIREGRTILRETRPDLTLAERNQIIKAFELESFRVKTLNTELTEFRYFDGLKDGAGLSGRWSTSNWIKYPKDRISILALPNNQATRAASVKLQSGTTVFQGTVAPQLNFGSNLTGGGSQSFNVLGPRAVIEEIK